MRDDDKKVVMVPDGDDSVSRAFRAYQAALAAREANSVRINALRRKALAPDMTKPLCEGLRHR